jgi:hypothetical protein
MTWVKPNTCYVIMPFSSTPKHKESEWTDIFQNFFRPILQSLRLDCHRSKALVGLVLRDIVESIHCSDVILADLTDTKPNVLYELGIAHTMTNNVVMVSQDISSTPSDLKPYGTIKYDHTTKEGVIEFTRNLSEALSRFRAEKPKPAGPVFDFLGSTHRLLEQFYQPAVNPIAYLECTKCHEIYEVPLGGITQGKPMEQYAYPVAHEHWEPAIFKGIKGIHEPSQ